MNKLPEQAHGTAIATTSGPAEAYAIDQSMVKLPSLYLAQYSSKAFKARTVEFGDIYVALGAEDPTPTIVGPGGNGDALGKPVRFYIHTVQPGYQVVDPSANYGKRTLRLGTTYGQALQEAKGDPRDVFLQTHYMLTIPDYPLWPVRFIMGSRWGGNSARWINTQVQLALLQDKRPLDLAFSICTRPTKNDSGDFVDSVVGFAKVPAKEVPRDQAIVSQHAELLGSGNVDISDYSEDVPVATEAPSLA